MQSVLHQIGFHPTIGEIIAVNTQYTLILQAWLKK
jgi:hypothetical protein